MLKALKTGENGDSTFQSEDGLRTVVIQGPLNITPDRHGILLSVDGHNFHETVLIAKEVHNWHRKLIFYSQFEHHLFRLELLETTSANFGEANIDAVLLDEVVLKRISTKTECTCLPAIFGKPLRSGNARVLNP
jgi:hypothetical protein